MKKILSDLEVQKRIISYTVSGILIFLGISLVNHFSVVSNFLSSLMKVLSPFIWGIIFSFFMCHFADFLEKNMPQTWPRSTKRIVSSLVSTLLLILLIVAILRLIIPQVITSLTSITKSVMSFINNAPDWFINIENKLNLSVDFTKDLNDYIVKGATSLLSFASTSIPNLIATTMSTVSSVFNFVIGFIVCIYVLDDRERLLRNMRNTFKATFSDKAYENLTILFNLLVNNIYKFFEGKIMDSAIIGVITFIFMVIARLEYPILIAVIVGITNIVPFFGPLIGAVPCVLILLIVNPVHGLIFAIYAVVIQQIDGNIIGPKILGDSVGLSSLWIMFSILVGGAYFGFIGMIMGVPVFSAIYILVKRWVSKRLDQKGLENPYK